MFRNFIPKMINKLFKPKDSLMQEFQEARRLYEKGDKKAALAMYENIVDKDAGFKLARSQIGKINGELRELEESKQVSSGKPKV